jgi:hypothetical protein
VTAAEASKFARKRMLIKPSFQWRISLIFVFLACVAVFLQAIVLSFGLTDVAADLQSDGAELLRRIPALVSWSSLLTAGVFVPLMAAVGILLTFRIAGPVYRFEKHLQQLLRGEQPGKCSIRKHDEFAELCALLNQYVESRSGTPVSPASPLPSSAALEQAPSLLPSSRSSEPSERHAA